MIKTLNFTDDTMLDRALLIQKVAYRIEADLIGFDGIPALYESKNDLRHSAEIFVGYFADDILAAVLSYSQLGEVLDIGRLVVHPDFFRQGIARALVQYVETIANVRRITVSTGAKNHPARKLYEKLGYQLLETVTLDAGVTIAQYEKNL